jgi:capsular polysaccharide biosynthesis protein
VGGFELAPDGREMSEKPTTHDGPAPAPPDDPPVDLRRVAVAVRRNGRGVAAAVGVVTLLVLVVSLLSPERYRATARIATDPGPGQVVDVETADRQLATDAELVTAPRVLDEAARRLPGESAETLARSVSAGFDPSVGMLDVAATAEDPARSRQIANTVAETFVAERDREEGRLANRARERLADEIDRLRTLDAPATTLGPMRERLSELAVTAATAGSGLRIVQRAPTPDGPYAPRPLRSALLAFLSALLVAVLVAIFRDQVRPARPDVAGLTRVTGLPLLAALPAAPAGPWQRLRDALGRRSRALDQAVIEEAALQGAVRSALPARGQRIVLVHGIDESGGASQAAAGLARSLIWGGHETVLVRFADDRRHAPDDVPTTWCADLDEQLDELKATANRYVVVEAPRTARGALRPLAARSAAVVLVARLDVATFADAAAAGRLVDALGLRGLGLVVVCPPSDIPDVVRTAMTAPLRPPSRPRNGSRNGVHAPAPAETVR